MSRVRGVVAALLSIVLVTASAGAQGPTTVELAQRRFEEGRKLMADGKLAEACAKFAESDRTMLNGGAVMNLADCLERRGQWEEAHAKFLEAASRAAEIMRPDIEAVALDRAKKLERHLPPPSPAPTPAPSATPAPAPAPAEPAARVGEPEPAPRRPDVVPDTSQGSTQRVLGLSTAGAGVVALGVGTLFALSASSKRSDVEAGCPAGVCHDPALVTMNEDAKSSADAATVLFVAGGVLAAGGAVLFFTAPSSSARAAFSPRARVGALALPGGGAATLAGSW
jgi:hypothetical protein